MNPKFPIWSEEEVSLLIENRNQPKLFLEKLLPLRTYNAIKAKVNSCGFKRRKDIGLNRDFFNLDKIDKKQAYLLGVFEAEASTKKRVISLAIGERDLDWLIKLRDLTESKATITKRIGGGFNPKSIRYRVGFSSVRMVEDIMKLGFRSQQLPKIKEELIPYYLSGYFDGDGTICWDKENECLISSFYGEENLIKEIYKWIINRNILANTPRHGPTCWGTKLHRIPTMELAKILPRENFMLDRKTKLLQGSILINNFPKKERIKMYKQENLKQYSKKEYKRQLDGTKVTVGN